MTRAASDSRKAAAPPGDPLATLRVHLEQRLAECERLLRRGVVIVDPATTYLEMGVKVGRDTVIYPNTTVSGKTVIGRGCRIGPNTVIIDSRIGDGCDVFASVLEGARLDDGVDVGPFSHLRPGSRLEAGVHVGNYVEVKAARLGAETKVGHFSYIGDADVGARVNIGAGTVTCNYDGRRKHRTVIGDDAFIGSDTMLVAPVRVGRGASTGAGSVVTENVPEGARVLGVPAKAAGAARGARSEATNSARATRNAPKPAKRQVRSKVG
jgi:bifunctional UDP-N-acetylglucosamine pyrophosphorylase/glucosamine-1-phosphate N-acetyltransferase